jgi:hypothetical protein
VNQCDTAFAAGNFYQFLASVSQLFDIPPVMSTRMHTNKRQFACAVRWFMTASVRIASDANINKTLFMVCTGRTDMKKKISGRLGQREAIQKRQAINLNHSEPQRFTSWPFGAVISFS